MNAKYISVWCVALLCTVFSNTSMGQTSTAGVATAVFQEGTWTKANDPLAPFICQCGGGNDCICSLASYCGSCGATGSNTCAVKIVAQSVFGNRLRVSFAKPASTNAGGGFPASIKHTAFTQKEGVKLDPATANALGYSSITVLPGKYTIVNNSVVFLITKGSAVPKPNH